MGRWGGGGRKENEREITLAVGVPCTTSRHDARPEYRDGHYAALRLQLPRPALQQRRPVPRDEVHLVNEEEDSRLGRVPLLRVQAIAVVRRILSTVMRADPEDVN